MAIYCIQFVCEAAAKVPPLLAEVRVSPLACFDSGVCRLCAPRACAAKAQSTRVTPHARPRAQARAEAGCIALQLQRLFVR